MKQAAESYNLKLDPKLLRSAKKQAESESRTLASLIRFVLEKYLREKAVDGE